MFLDAALCLRCGLARLLSRPPRGTDYSTKRQGHCNGTQISIAFRRSAVSRHCGRGQGGEDFTSPLPFGVQRFPAKSKQCGASKPNVSPLPFGVHRFPDRITWRSTSNSSGVSIAFRRSAVPRHGLEDRTRSVCSGVSIAFRRSAVSRLGGVARMTESRTCLHCLSAFTAFPAWSYEALTCCGMVKSPLPFGVHRVSRHLAATPDCLQP